MSGEIQYPAWIEALVDSVRVPSWSACLYTWKKIKHKDLKSSNILITRENIFIADFVTSTDFSDRSASRTDTEGRGTPRYFALEVAEWGPNGRASGVFSLGCIFPDIAYVLFGRLDLLKGMMPDRDNSFHANLDMTDAWLRQLSSRGGLVADSLSSFARC
ncbi:hypothetical protein BU26DRAFT_161750 [Trematosphaeria pertusa]|uniref:Protein kinase domain-containing protein n=1 Tax=Trematosphaeria pertusa TaxID=390896 RepID=A0A6A6HX58_9PLEO|nr:uncharacterized protein BU26DRAFT_161750 [Trematosphaeria pertusa]KAF2242479.1 hypothetical protein BU26DRAFT_161750 [Trematosphaeria pertusa]